MTRANLQEHSILIVGTEGVTSGEALETDLRDPLELAGAETMIARTLPEALDRTKQYRFTSVVLDCEPGHADCARALIDALPGTPILLYGSAPPPDLKVPFVLKTARRDEIAAALSAMVGD